MMREEIDNYLIAADEEHHFDTEAEILWAVHVHFGSGKRKLKKFYKDFNKIHQDLLNHYSMREDDALWLIHRKLHEIGVDVREWYKELHNDKD